MKPIKTILFAMALMLMGASENTADACSRVMYKGLNGIVMTARTMDWPGNMPTALWIMPRELHRDGYAGPKSIEWTAKYGSVIAESFGGVSDGMNEKGLMANMLWLRGTGFVNPETSQKPQLSVGLWAQFLLDNFATVNEAVEAMQEQKFDVVGMMMPGLDFTLDVHVSISDTTGDNAIFEYIGGKLFVYHNEDYKVMTNEPTYDKQLAIAEYWKNISGFTAMPGTIKPEDKFVRATFYSNSVAPTNDADKAAAIAMSIAREISVPMGMATEERPNMSTTIWRVVADHKNRIYYFEDAEKFNSAVWIDLKKVDFSFKKGTRRLDMTKAYNGDVSDKLIKTDYLIDLQN